MRTASYGLLLAGACPCAADGDRKTLLTQSDARRHRSQASYSPARYAAGALLHGAAGPQQQEQGGVWGPPAGGVRVVPAAMPTQPTQPHAASEGGEGATAAAVGRVKAMLGEGPWALRCCLGPCCSSCRGGRRRYRHAPQPYTAQTPQPVGRGAARQAPAGALHAQAAAAAAPQHCHPK